MYRFARRIACLLFGWHSEEFYHWHDRQCEWCLRTMGQEDDEPPSGEGG